MSLRAALAGLGDNPVFERERLMRARSWGMPLGMSLYICAIGGAALLQFSWANAGADGTPTAQGMARAAFLAASLQLVVVFLAVPPAAASAIATERDRGMFDLVLLGGLSPRSIVWSELVAALAYRLLLVVVAAPVLLAVFLYAGLGLGQFLLTELLTVAVAVSVGAVALLLGTVMTKALGAALATYGLVFALRFGIITTGALVPADVALNPSPGAPPAVYPLVFATPFYALKALLTGPSPSGAHLGHLVGLALGQDSNPASWGPVVQPWQAALAGMVAVTVVCMALATRVVAGKRPSSRRRLRGLRRLAKIEVRLPRRSPAGTAEGRKAGSARNAITTVACAVILAVVVGGLGRAAQGQSPPPDSPLAVTAAPRWGRSTPGAWTPYLVTMTNRGTANFAGELVLVPETTPPPPPPRTDPEQAAAPVFPVIAVGGTELTLPRGPGGPVAPGDFPTHRTAVSLTASDAPRTLTVLVVEAPYGYRAELHDASGRPVAATPNSGGPQADQTETIALLGGTEQVASTLRGLADYLGPTTGSLTVLASARDVPDSALQLSGLQALVIHGFDTATLGPGQLRAVQDFVALGGNLVLTGGGEATGMLRALPEALVPLSPTGTATAGMGPLAGLVARTTEATATVITGQLRSGRVMLATDDGLPLVVEADYGAGRVVQLVYDPQDETLASDPVLRDLAWQQGVSRALTRFPGGGPNLAPVPGQLWAPALGGMGWPQWPAPALWLLVGYALVGCPAAYGLSRSRRNLGAIWAVAPAVAVVITVASGLTPVARGDGQERAVQVTRAGPGEATLRSSYLGLQATSDGGRTVVPGTGVAASTVFAPPTLTSVDAVPGVTAWGAGAGSVADRGDKVEVTVPTRFGEIRNVNLVSVEQRPTLESHLRLTGTGRPGGGSLRLLGTVTNRSAEPIRRLRAQLPEGALARIADVIRPGDTLQVDAPMTWPESVQAGSRPRADSDELVLFAAAARSFTRGGQVVVAGIEQAQAGELAVLTEVVALGGAERVIAGSGAATLVAIAPSATAERVIVQDLAGLPGLKAAEISYSTYYDPPEVFDWTTKTWRLLPPGDRGVGLTDGSPVTPSEVRADGLVRVRVRLFELGPCCTLTNSN